VDAGGGHGGVVLVLGVLVKPTHTPKMSTMAASRAAPWRMLPTIFPKV
jgi:hypothetical protein